MGRLYDKRDLAFNMDYWDRREQQLHADIANGLISAGFLDQVITESREHAGEPCHKGCGCRSYRVREGFDLERKRERMKLLRTGSLLGDLSFAQSNFDKCPSCHMERRGTKTLARECPLHSPALKRAKSSIYWAGERNLEERNLRGQIRAEGLQTAKIALEGLERSSSGMELNHWEAWYQRDKAQGIWPNDAERYDCSPDYKGWLEMLFTNEEMTEAEYLEELGRVRLSEHDKEEAALQWAGGTTRQSTRKGREVFKKDTRFNITSAA